MRYRQLFIFLMGLVHVLQAQEQKKISLDRMADWLVHKEDISISYDVELLRLSSIAYDTSSFDVVDFSKALSEQLPFELVQLDEKSWLIKPVSKTFSISFVGKDEEDDRIVSMLSAGGKVIRSSQNNDRLSFDYLPKAKDTLLLNVIGYADMKIPVSQLLNAEIIELLLKPIHIELDGITVYDFITKGININPSNQTITIQTSQLPLLPGETDGDLFASLVSLPGVSTPDNRAGNLFIRGSSTDQTYLLYDNIPIYHRGHYYGTISPYNPRVVSQVDVNRGGFHPRLGGKVGGAVNIQSIDASSIEKNTGLGVNTLYSSGFVNTPIASGKVGISVGARKSHPNSFHSPKLIAISDAVFDASAIQDSTGSINESLMVDFEDYQLNLVVKPTDKSTFRLTGIYTSSLTSYVLNPGPMSTEESNLIKNPGANFSWNQRWSKKWSSQLDMTVSKYTFQFETDLSQGVINPLSLNNLIDLKGKYEIGTKSQSGNVWQVGVEVQHQDVESKFVSLNASPIPNQLPIVYRYGTREIGRTWSLFSNYQWLSHTKWYLHGGARLDYYVPMERWLFSPRAFLSYDLVDDFVVKASGGRYYQALSQIQDLEFSSGGFSNQMWALAGVQDGNLLTSDQWMVGALATFGEWVLDIEYYNKLNQNVTYSSTSKLAIRTQFLACNQSYKGVDVTVKHALGDYGTAWVGYSYIDGKVWIDTVETITYDDKYAQPHVLFAGGSYLRDKFKLSAGWKYASGLSTQTLEFAREVYTISQYSQNQGQNILSLIESLPSRYKPIHTLDVSASYLIPKTEKIPFKSTMGVSLINTYNANNLTDMVLRAGTGNASLIGRYAVRFAPNIMITIEW